MVYEHLFLIALAQTIAIETVGLILIFQLMWKTNEEGPTVFQIITAGVLCSGLTLPYLWFVLPTFLIDRTLYVWVGEVTVTLIEFLMLKRLLKISWLQALVASIVVNVTSVLIGIYFL